MNSQPCWGVQSVCANGAPGCAQGISKNLVTRAFPDYERPDYLTSAEFFKFTPVEEFMSLPGDIARTEFRLVRLPVKLFVWALSDVYCTAGRYYAASSPRQVAEPTSCARLR